MAPDGTCIVAASENRVYLFSTQDNEPIWVYEAGEPIISVKMAEGGHLAAQDNEPIWEYRSVDTPISEIAIGAGYIAVNDENILRLFSYQENMLIWSYPRYRWGGYEGWIGCLTAIFPIPYPEIYYVIYERFKAFASGAETMKLSMYGHYLVFLDREEIKRYGVRENTLTTVLSESSFPKGRFAFMSMSSLGDYIAVGLGSVFKPDFSPDVALFSLSENAILWTYED